MGLFMETLLWSLGATFLASLMSLVGIFSFFIKDKILHNTLLYLVALSAGALIGGAFFHLLPEAVEASEGMTPFTFVIIGIISFFILEKILHWRHCHEEGNCKVHPFTYMNLVGDGMHNFLDGMIIFSAFSVSVQLGIVTTLAVIIHELPQEIGDFGVLVYGGFSKIKALLWNFISATVAILGVFVAYFAHSAFEGFSFFLIPFAAGGFIYIAMSDLIPELHKEPKVSKSMAHFMSFSLGLVFMYLIKIIFEG